MTLETYFNVMCSKYPSLWEVVRQVLLSPGQAAVERGFSLNKAVSRENQLPESLVSLRLVKDHLNTVGFTNMEVSKELLTSCSSARQKYMSSLEAKKNEKSMAASKHQHVIDEIESLKRRCLDLQKDVDTLNAESDKFLSKALAQKNILKKQEFIVSCSAICKVAFRRRKQNYQVIKRF